MLKHGVFRQPETRYEAAAFRRLCVETRPQFSVASTNGTAAFRRLCVETGAALGAGRKYLQPPLGGCVLKLIQ